MKYKVGDVVKVRQDLELGKRYGTNYFVEEMRSYEKVTIEEVESGYYTVEENYYNYTDEMIEGLEIDSFKLGYLSYQIENIKDIDDLKTILEKVKTCIGVLEFSVGDIVKSISDDWTNGLVGIIEFVDKDNTARIIFNDPNNYYSWWLSIDELERTYLNIHEVQL